MTRIIYSVLLLMTSYFGLAQASKKDSLINELNSVGSSSDKVFVLLELARHHLYKSIDSTNNYITQAKAFLPDEPDDSLYLTYAETLGAVLRQNGQLDSAAQVMESSLAFIDELDKARQSSEYILLEKPSIYIALVSCYQPMGYYEKALEYSIKALNVYDSLQRTNPSDRRYKELYARGLNTMAITHSDFESDSIGMHYFKQALEVYEQNYFPEKAAFTYFNIAVAYMNDDLWDSVIYYLKKSEPIIDSLSLERLKTPLLHNLSYAYLEAGQIDKSTSYIDDYIKVALAMQSDYNLARAYSLKSLYLRSVGQSQEALEYAEKGLSIPLDNLKIRESLLEDQAQSLEDLGRYKEALPVWKGHYETVDSLLSVESKASFAEIEAKYQNEKKARELLLQQSEIELLQKDNNIKALWTNILLAGIISLFVFGVLVYRNSYLKKEKLKTSLSLEKIEKENQKLKAQELNREVEFQNQKLTSYALNSVQKNEWLISLRDDLNEVEDGTEDWGKRLNRIKRSVEQKINKEENWEDFKVHFEGVHKDFFLKLKETYPDLTTNDLRVCALTLLNMNLKESAEMLGISPESVKMARYRLKKRMTLEKDDSLMNHLVQYSKS